MTTSEGTCPCVQAYAAPSPRAVPRSRDNGLWSPGQRVRQHRRRPVPHGDHDHGSRRRRTSRDEHRPLADAETELIGCVYIDPATRAGAGAEVSWWVRDEHVGSAVEAALDELVPRWIAEGWLARPVG